VAAVVSPWDRLILEVQMGAARSKDLRSRVVAEVAAGLSRRQAAARFKVSAASAVRWVALEAQTGSVDPRPRGGRSRSPLEPHAAWLLKLNASEGDLTLAELVRRLREELEVTVTEASIRRFFKRHAITYKKNSARQRADAARRGRSARALAGAAAKP
jgi:transposase